MGREKFFTRFHLLVIAFVLSIALLIFCPNLITLLLGWDGLGVTSYLLVIYFQNRKAYGAGIITALTNRIGDVLILVAIASLVYLGRPLFWLNAAQHLFKPNLVFILIIAGITKSAQVPFSAWLPAAMAAPTPVSSLVHSSTLVTAGVYLTLRLRGDSHLSFTLFVVGVSTIIIARIRAIWEMDMKKIVALSTLSQLGLIFCSIGLGLFKVTFFHLLTHAYFKAILFMSVGNSIHLSNDYQDLRKIGLCHNSLPSTLRFAIAANIRLCGLPFIAGFYSKDSILEIIRIEQFSLARWALFYTAVALTLLYSLRFTLMIRWGFTYAEPLTAASDTDSLIIKSMTILLPLTVMAGRSLSYLLFSESLFICLPVEIKNLTLAIILLGIIISWHLPNYCKNSHSASWNWGNIWTLPLISTATLISRSLNTGKCVRKLDLSWTPDFLIRGAPGNYATLGDYLSLKKFFWGIFIVGGASWLLLVIYLCVIKLIIIFKFKFWYVTPTHIYKHKPSS